MKEIDPNSSLRNEVKLFFAVEKLRLDSRLFSGRRCACFGGDSADCGGIKPPSCIRSDRIRLDLIRLSVGCGLGCDALSRSLSKSKNTKNGECPAVRLRRQHSSVPFLGLRLFWRMTSFRPASTRPSARAAKAYTRAPGHCSPPHRLARTGCYLL